MHNPAPNPSTPKYASVCGAIWKGPTMDHLGFTAEGRQ